MCVGGGMWWCVMLWEGAGWLAGWLLGEGRGCQAFLHTDQQLLQEHRSMR